MLKRNRESHLVSRICVKFLFRSPPALSFCAFFPIPVPVRSFHVNSYPNSSGAVASSLSRGPKTLAPPPAQCAPFFKRFFKEEAAGTHSPVYTQRTCEPATLKKCSAPSSTPLAHPTHLGCAIISQLGALFSRKQIRLENEHFATRKHLPGTALRAWIRLGGAILGI